MAILPTSTLLSLSLLFILSSSWLAVSLATPPGTRPDHELESLYESWLAHHGKAYNGLGEKAARFEIFKDNLKFIDEHNSLNRSYRLGLNKFADLTNEEYRAKFLGTRPDAKRRVMKAKAASDRYAVRAGDRLPRSVDWRAVGAVNPVKDQGYCVSGVV